MHRRDLIFARLYYFTFMGGWGFILPFINLFYVDLGLSGKEIGLIASTSSLVGMVAAPVWVSQVKKHPQAQRFLQLALVLGAAGYFMVGQQTSFLPIVIIVFMQAIASSGIMPLSDSMAVSVSQKASTGYGSVRVWASFGWIITVLTSGALVERLGFVSGFVGVCLMWLLSAGVVVLIDREYFTGKPGVGTSASGLLTAVHHVIGDRTLLGFAIALIFVGFLNSGVLQFENVYLSQLGASKQLISVAGILSAVVELPFMIWADRIVRRFGPHRLMLAALSMTFFQRATVLLLPSIATIMIVRFIGGMAFSFYTISYMGLISSRTEQSETGTILALFTMTISGLVNIIASPVGGALFDALGTRWLYAFSMTGYAIAVSSLWLTRPKSTSSPSI